MAMTLDRVDLELAVRRAHQAYMVATRGRGYKTDALISLHKIAEAYLKHGPYCTQSQWDELKLHIKP